MIDKNLAEQLDQTSRSFHYWFSENVAKERVHLMVIPEIMSTLYLRGRMWLTREQMRYIMENIIDQMEGGLERGEMLIELRDGTEVPMQTAEYYEENPEARDMLIQASWHIDQEQDWDISALDGNSPDTDSVD